VNYVLAVLAAVLLGVASVLQQAVAEQAPSRDFLHARLLLDLLRYPRWLAGVGVMVSGQLLSIWVLGHTTLSVAEPLLASSLLFALVLAWPLSRQPLTRSEVAGALMLMAGVTILSLSRTLQSPEMIVGGQANWPYAAAGTAGLAVALASLGRRWPGSTRAMLTGASAGVTFGLQDALTRRMVQDLSAHGVIAPLRSWPVYVLIATGLAGFWLMQNAFSAGPLHASLPAITAAEPVIGIMLGLMVFGDRLRISPTLISLQATALVLLVFGVILVASGPALAPLRRPATRRLHR